MKRPLTWLVLSFCLGISAAGISGIPFLAAYGFGYIESQTIALSAYLAACIFFLLGIFLFRKPLWFNLSLFCCIFFLGVSTLRNCSTFPKCHVYNYLSYGKENIYTVKGIVIDQPQIKANKAVFPFKIRQIYFNRLARYACGEIRVYANTKKQLRYGDELLLTGSFWRRKYQHHKNTRNQDILPVLQVKSPLYTIKLNENKGFFLKRLALRIKEKIEETIFKRLSPVPAAIVDAMILGERKHIPVLVYNSMIKSGTVHILVVSGFNVGIVLFIIMLALKFIRLNRTLRIYAAFPLLVIYCLATGASTPVLRATIMAAVFMSAFLLKREPDIYNSCATAAMIILAGDPRKLFDIGSQLSFATVLSIIFLYPRIKLFLGSESLRPKYVKFLLNTLVVSLCAWLGTLGLVAFYFGTFSPVTVLANLFIAPQAVLLTLCGFSFIAAAFICPPAAYLFAHACELLVVVLIKTNALLIKLPGAYFRIY